MPRSISAYVNDTVASLFEQVVAQEHRKAAQVAAQALDLYVLLPFGARRALGFVRSHGTQADHDLLLEEFSRAVIRVQLKIAQRQVDALLEQTEHAGTSKEDDIDAFLKDADPSRSSESLGVPAGARAGAAGRAAAQ